MSLKGSPAREIDAKWMTRLEERSQEAQGSRGTERAGIIASQSQKGFPEKGSGEVDRIPRQRRSRSVKDDIALKGGNSFLGQEMGWQPP